MRMRIDGKYFRIHERVRIWKKLGKHGNQVIRNGIIAYIILYRHNGTPYNKYVTIDAEDIPRVQSYMWSLQGRPGHDYAHGPLNSYSSHPRTYQTLASFILNKRSSDKMQIDHINRNRLDNRKSNLRYVTRNEQSRNRTLTGKGIWWDERRKKYRTYIGHTVLGFFSNKKDAIRARAHAVRQYYENLNNSLKVS